MQRLKFPFLAVALFCFVICNAAQSEVPIGFIKISKDSQKLQWDIPDTIKISVVKSDGSPLPKAVLTLIASDEMDGLASPENGRKIESVSDESGIVTFSMKPFRSMNFSWMRLSIVVDDFVPMYRYWTYIPVDGADNHFVLPSEMTVPMTPAKTISGQVVDEEGHPVADVSCYPIVEASPPPGFVYGFRFEKIEAKTDAEGKWNLALMPENVDENEIGITLRHPDYILKSRDSIERKTTHLSHQRQVLHRGRSVSGKITDDKGKPIAGAAVSTFVRKLKNGEPVSGWEQATQSDPDGLYILKGLTESISPIRVEAPGKVVQEKEIDSLDKTHLESVDFTLRRGKTVRFRVIDEQGNAMPNVTVRCDRFRGMENVGKTDSAGRCELNHVSDDWTSYSFEAFDALFQTEGNAPDCMRVSYSVSKESEQHYPPRDEEYVVKLIRKEQRSGYYKLPETMSIHVVDQNNQPMPDASVFIQFTTNQDETRSNHMAKTDSKGNLVADFSTISPAAVTGLRIHVTKDNVSNVENRFDADWHDSSGNACPAIPFVEPKDRIGNIPSQMTIDLFANYQLGKPWQPRTERTREVTGFYGSNPSLRYASFRAAVSD